jgi:threonine synthase
LKYYSTKNKDEAYSFREAVLLGLPKDNGLFMPERIPPLSAGFLGTLSRREIHTIAYEICRQFIGDEIPGANLEALCREAFTFPVPLIQLDDDTFIAELFHGPTLAFKDFGARFMARVMSFLNRGESKKLTILVATSGDTGGAVADGFFNVEGVEVYILYPSGGVSELQEKQLTTYGNNIHAIEIKGTFDDCQNLVKQAFLDDQLSGTYRLSSANSINIARLIPQMIYYFTSCANVKAEKDIFITVPSGNFGNLTAGIFAKRMGLPVKHFIAASNANDSVLKYLSGNNFTPHKSIATISNAMDVGNPSNFGRMQELFNNSLNEMREEITAFSISDATTENTMREIYSKFNYVLDPHGAVGISGWRNYNKDHDGTGIIFETAHPAKFIETVEKVLNVKIPLPELMGKLKSLSKTATLLPADFSLLKEYLLSIY